MPTSANFGAKLRGLVGAGATITWTQPLSAERGRTLSGSRGPKAYCSKAAGVDLPAPENSVEIVFFLTKVRYVDT